MMEADNVSDSDSEYVENRPYVPKKVVKMRWLQKKRSIKARFKKEKLNAGKWTEDEHDRLIKACQKHDKNWTKVSNLLI